MGQRQEFSHSKSESVELAGWKFEGVSRRAATGISPEPGLVRVHGFVGASGGFRRHSMHGGDATEPIDEGDVDVDQAVLDVKDKVDLAKRFFPGVDFKYEVDPNSGMISNRKIRDLLGFKEALFKFFLYFLS